MKLVLKLVDDEIENSKLDALCYQLMQQLLQYHHQPSHCHQSSMNVTTAKHSARSMQYYQTDTLLIAIELDGDALLVCRYFSFISQLET